MANKYYKNFILWGEVDFYCLICDETFQDLGELDKHMRWGNHLKALKSQDKSHKFKKEIIYQVGELFYCERCNFVSSISNIEVMNTHIASEEHKIAQEKPKTDAELTNNACKRDSEYVIVSDIIVEEKDWNCITHIENYCLVCGVYIPMIYARVVEHIKAKKHMINLIAAKVYVENDRFYRKLYSNYFYCLCCKEAIPMSFFESHWTAKEHCDFRNDCIFKTTYANENAARAIEEKKKNIEKGLIYKLLAEFYFIHDEKESAVCKECLHVVKLDFKTMNDHKKSHNNANPVTAPVVEAGEDCGSSSDEDTYEVIFSELTDHGQRRRELSKYGKKNDIRLNSGGSKGFCRICCTTISGHLKLFKEHVKGARHRGHLELMGLKKSKIHKFPAEKFKMITEFINNLHFSETIKLLCINREICIDIYSFILVYEIEKRFQYKSTKCLICDVLYPYSFDFEHYGTAEHKKRFLSVKVMAKEGEFIREIRPDVYHCGVCNKIYPFWELMEKHLLSKIHIDMKNINKYKVFEQQTFDEKLLKTSSKSPDILYLQLLSIGIIKSKGVPSVKDMQTSNAGVQTVNTNQVTNTAVQSVNIMHNTNASIQTEKETQATDASARSVDNTQVANESIRTVNPTQTTSAGTQSVNNIQVTNAQIKTVNAMQITNAGTQTVNATQATNAGVQCVDVKETTNAGVQTINTMQITNAGTQTINATQTTNAGAQCGDIRQTMNTGVQTENAMQITNAATQTVNAAQAINASAQSVDVGQTINAAVQTVNAMQVTNSGTQTVNATLALHASVQTENATQVTNAGIQTVNATQSTNADAQSFDAMAAIEADIQSVNHSQGTNGN